MYVRVEAKTDVQIPSHDKLISFECLTKRLRSGSKFFAPHRTIRPFLKSMESPWSPVQLVENATAPALLLVAYFFGCGVNIANYVGYFRYHTDVYGGDLPRAYLAFVILGTGTYILFSGMMWMWAAKYSSTREERAQKLSNGVWAIFFLKDLPLFIIEYNAILCCGWLNGYQGFAFIFELLFALFSFVFTWLSITWRGSEWLQNNFGGVQGLKTGTERIVIFNSPPPGMTTQKFVPPGFQLSDEQQWRSPGATGPTFNTATRQHADHRSSSYMPPTPLPLRPDATLNRMTHVATPRDLDSFHRDKFHAEMQSNPSSPLTGSPARFLVVPEQHDSAPDRSPMSSASGSRAFSPRDQRSDNGATGSPFRGSVAPQRGSLVIERHVF